MTYAPTHHFRERAIERIGPTVDPDALAAVLSAAIDDPSDDRAVFLRKVHGCNLRLFQFRLDAERVFYALVNCVDRTLVTVLIPSHTCGVEDDPDYVLPDARQMFCGVLFHD